MKVLVFGATGMVGQGVLRECLLDAGVELVQTVGRTPNGRGASGSGANEVARANGVARGKLREVVCRDLYHYDGMEAQLAGFDACFFCLGVTSSGMKEADYERVTYGLTLAAAEMLSRVNAKMTFIYVSGAGTDSTEKGRSMWARVKGKTENALMRLPFAGAYMFRPGIIQPAHGEQSRTALYRIFYSIGRPLMPLARRAFPNQVLTTEQVGRAMLEVGRHGYEKRVMEIADIRMASERYASGAA
jgi:uncharacterized protein YbjT (DUF2867 family)